ncbi:hypothetical protein RQP46_003176 [Phenoliferia psychrophenolica]
MSSNYLLDSLSSMRQSSALIASLPFRETRAFAYGALASTGEFEQRCLRDAEPHELALFTTTETKFDPATASGVREGWTATKRPAPKRAMGNRAQASPFKERRGIGNVDPARALRAAQKLLEIYPLKRAQEHVDGLFDQYDGLITVLQQLDDALKRPISRQTVQTKESIEAAEREEAIKNEEMEIFALQQIKIDKQAENDAMNARLKARKPRPATAPAPPAATIPKPSLPTRAAISRPAPIPKSTTAASSPSSPSSSTSRTRVPSTPPRSAGATPMQVTTTPRARVVSAPVIATAAAAAKARTPSKQQQPHSPKGKRPAGVPMEDLDVFSAKIWNGVGDALRPWARRTLLDDSLDVPSPLRSLPFTPTYKSLGALLATPPSHSDGPASPTSSFATLTSDAFDETDPLPPSPPTLVESQLLNLLLSTLSGLPAHASLTPLPSSSTPLPVLTTTMRDAVLPSSLAPSSFTLSTKDKDPMVSMNGLKAHLTAQAMLVSLLLPLSLVSAAIAGAVPRQLPALTPPTDGADAQLNQSTSPARVLSYDEKLLLGGQLAYIVQLTTCLPADVKARTCGLSCDATPGYTVLTQGGDASAVDFWGVGVSKELDAVVVSFSGTNTSSVISTSNNAQAELVPMDASYASLASRAGPVPLVHAGYQAVTLKAMKDVMPGVTSALAAYPNITRVIVSGHSQGAAMSVFASLSIFLGVPSKIHVQLLSYALPRPGNGDFAQLVNTVLPDHQTVTFRGDAIPHALFPGPIYRHSMGERWIQAITGDGVNNVENSHVLACDGEENINCSDSLSAAEYQPADHVGPYFGVLFGQSTCTDYNVTMGQTGL